MESLPNKLILTKRCNYVMYLKQQILKQKILKQYRLKQQGLGLPVAIFVITIMSIVAVAINRINESGSQSYGQNVLSTRAFYAAESGAQLRSQSVLPALPELPCACGGSAGVVYEFDVAGLNQCRATTTCTSFIANGETYCTIQSIGQCDNANAERTVEVRLK